MTLLGMTIDQCQVALLVLAMALCVVLLVKARIVWAKLVVAIGLTLIALVQCLSTPLDRTVQNYSAQIAILHENNPKYGKLKERRDEAQERIQMAREGKGRWTDLLPFRLGLDLQGGTEVRLRLREDKSRLQRLKRDLEQLQSTASGAERDKQIQTLQAEIREEENETSKNFDNAVDVIRERLNASGLAEIPVTRQGHDRVLVQLPGMGEAETDQIIQMLQLQGKLEFRLVVPEKGDPSGRFKGDHKFYSKIQSLGFEKDTLNITPGEYRALRPEEINDKGQEAATGLSLYDWLRTPDTVKKTGQVEPGQFRLVEQDVQIGGDRIVRARAESDPTQGGWRVAIAFDQKGSALFERITSNNVGKQLGIVLDGKLRSAPNLNEAIGGGRAVITGNFDREEAEQLATVLKSGSLKVKIEPEFKSSIGPSLGRDSIRQGLNAMLLGLAAVVVFMLIYYLAAGVVTNIALMINLILIVACLSAWDATLTLPGIAGLILTVGMAVDANVLIFERIREEREKGNSLSRAIDLGYERAFVTIVDANVTTLITALILHSFGTETIKGFALTLVFGILMSMFCSLVVTRWIFAGLLEWSLVKELKMLRIFSKPKINFISLRRPAMVLSIVAILAGLVVFGMRGHRNYGHDFTGGTLAQISLKTGLTEDEARKRAATMEEAGFTDVAQSMQSFGEPGAGGTFTQFVLRTQLVRPTEEEGGGRELKSAADFKTAIRKAFPELPDQSLRVSEKPLEAWSDTQTAVYHLDINTAESVKAKDLQALLVKETKLVNPRVIRPEQGLPAEPVSKKAQITVEIPAKDKDGKDYKEGAYLATVQALLTESKLEQTLVDLKAGLSDPVRVFGSVPAEKLHIRLSATLKRSVTSSDVTKALAADDKAGWTLVKSALVDAGGVPAPDEVPATRFVALVGVPRRTEMGALRSEALQARFVQEEFRKPVNKGMLAMTDPFPRFTSVGAVVATEMQASAIGAMLFAMIAIFFYIWLRFQFRASFGLGAVAALVHDVLFTVGALAIADQMNLLNGQIDLKIVAALLTIVGYSLNDTIVVFDRVRENMGNGNNLKEVINTSINQTVSRTIITSLTTLLVVAFLLVLGGDVIRGFAFALFVGVLVGTYSSIFIASPLLVEMVAVKAWRDKQKAAAKQIASAS